MYPFCKRLLISVILHKTHHTIHYQAILGEEKVSLNVNYSVGHRGSQFIFIFLITYLHTHTHT